jgi:hypothetical protein
MDAICLGSFGRIYKPLPIDVGRMDWFSIREDDQHAHGIGLAHPN